MPIQPYKKNNHNIFKKPVQLVGNAFADSKLTSIMQDLFDTHFQDKNKIGVGLAANQIGYPYSIFLTYISDARAQKEKCEPIPVTFWLNASYLPKSDEISLASEGCFSVPGMMARNVKRYQNIIVNAQRIQVSINSNNEINIINRKTISINLSGFQARLFQHEIDHVNKVKPSFFYEHTPDGESSLIPMENIGDPRTQ